MKYLAVLALFPIVALQSAQSHAWGGPEEKQTKRRTTHPVTLEDVTSPWFADWATCRIAADLSMLPTPRGNDKSTTAIVHDLPNSRMWSIRPSALTGLHGCRDRMTRSQRVAVSNYFLSQVLGEGQLQMGPPGGREQAEMQPALGFLSFSQQSFCGIAMACWKGKDKQATPITSFSFGPATRQSPGRGKIARMDLALALFDKMASNPKSAGRVLGAGWRVTKEGTRGHQFHGQHYVLKNEKTGAQLEVSLFADDNLLRIWPNSQSTRDLDAVQATFATLQRSLQHRGKAPGGSASGKAKRHPLVQEAKIPRMETARALLNGLARNRRSAGRVLGAGWEVSKPADDPHQYVLTNSKTGARLTVSLLSDQSLIRVSPASDAKQDVAALQATFPRLQRSLARRDGGFGPAPKPPVRSGVWWLYEESEEEHKNPDVVQQSRMLAEAVPKTRNAVQRYLGRQLLAALKLEARDENGAVQRARGKLGADRWVVRSDGLADRVVPGLRQPLLHALQQRFALMDAADATLQAIGANLSYRTAIFQPIALNGPESLDLPQARYPVAAAPGSARAKDVKPVHLSWEDGDKQHELIIAGASAVYKVK